jgi:ABC-type polysaccharide/polyol phosphate transport system ATPase subunit
MPYGSELGLLEEDFPAPLHAASPIDSSSAAPAGWYDLDPAVRVENLWIRYKTTSEQTPTVQSRVTKFFERGRKAQYVEALRGVSFDVPVGAVYGVIGHNGAGKSTLFRTLAGILPPTAGRVTVYGRVTPLLSLGVGFNRELTGRENILLGGLATGLQPDEIMDHYDDVVAFAELGPALEYPMKTYSSGMFARLGFAVASHLEPEILLIDEALSAGDARFKNRCMDKLVELCGHDCTVMIISHGLQLITLLAERAVWLELGQVRMEGPAPEVVESYLASEDIDDSVRAEMAAALEDL